MSNFKFLKNINANLFNIISEAEKLFRDEYFEQVCIQARRFAENLCKDILQNKVLPDDTFDTMINKIKDNSFGNTRMQEFYDDLYFLKKHGNNSAHSSVAKSDGKIALECLERAYEIAIFYANIKSGYDKKLDSTVFSEELLMTGKITGKKSSPIKLKDKYTNELKIARSKDSIPSKTQSKKTPPIASAQKIAKSRKITKPKKTIKKQSSKKNSKLENFKINLLKAIILIVILFFVGCFILDY